MAYKVRTVNVVDDPSVEMEKLYRTNPRITTELDQDAAFLTQDEKADAPVRPAPTRRTTKETFNYVCSQIAAFFKALCSKLCACFSRRATASPAATTNPSSSRAIRSSHAVEMQPIAGGKRRSSSPAPVIQPEVKGQEETGSYAPIFAPSRQPSSQAGQKTIQLASSSTKCSI